MGSRKLALLLTLVLVISMTVPACAPQGEQDGAQEEEIGRVTVVGVWGGGEIENFNRVVDGWEEETGGTMEFEGTRDLTAILRARVSGQNPPDLAILPNPALMQNYARSGDLQPLDEVLGAAFQENFSETWIDQMSVDGQVYGLVVKASPKSTVWYNPRTFEEKGWETPTSWDQLDSLAERMVADGTPPWSIGVEEGGASGWPASDWVQELLLAESGPEVYDQWVDHEIPWTDDAVRQAFERFGNVVHDDDMVLGGSERIVSTTPQDSTFAPYQDPPTAQMCFLGAFAQGFIEGQFEDLEAGTGYDFFDFPAINQQYEGAATGGGDIVVMFNDNASTRSLVQYLAEGESWRPWAEAGGYTTPNRGLAAEAYPDDVARKAAEQLTESQIFRFDADDLMPAEVQNAFWSGLLEYIQDEDSLDNVLRNIENVAEEAYAQREEEQGQPGGEGTEEENQAPDAGEEETQNP
jgi:alpha-glucoside transport system substrate-binding protein